MSDTGFFAPADKHERLAGRSRRPDTGAAVELINVRAAPAPRNGQRRPRLDDGRLRALPLMLYRGGTLGGARILGRRRRVHDRRSPRPGGAHRHVSCLRPATASALVRGPWGMAPTPGRWANTLGRHRRHGVLDRAAGGTDRPDDDPGARSARLLPAALPLSDARRARVIPDDKMTIGPRRMAQADLAPIHLGDRGSAVCRAARPQRNSGRWCSPGASFERRVGRG